MIQSIKRRIGILFDKLFTVKGIVFIVACVYLPLKYISETTWLETALLVVGGRLMMSFIAQKYGGSNVGIGGQASTNGSNSDPSPCVPSGTPDSSDKDPGKNRHGKGRGRTKFYSTERNPK